MPITNVKGPGGVVIPVRHPEGASESEIIAYAQANYQPPAATPPAPAPAPQIKGYLLPGDQPVTDVSPAAAPGANLGRDQRAFLAAMQGPTFGFADEIAGGVVGGAKTLFNGKPYQQNYEAVRDAYRGAVDRQLKEEPLGTATEQFIASLPVGGPLARVFGPARTLTSQIVSGTGVGAVSGAANALGSSTAPDVGGKVDDSLLGLGAGMAMGGLGVPLVRAAGAAGSNVMQRFDDSAAMDYARQKIAQAFIRDAAPGVSDPLSQAGARMTRLGPEARVVDAGGQSGQSTTALLDTVATLPGRSKSAVETAIRQRQSGRADRMIGSAEDAFGVGGVRMASQMDDWMQQRATQAAPLYERLHRMDVPASQNLSSIVDAARANGYDKIAARIARNKQQPFTLPQDSSMPTGTYSMRDLDYLKQGMDDALVKLRDPVTGNLTAEGKSVDELRRKLLAQLDRDTMGQYANARNAFAGPSQLMDASNAGRRILSRDDATIRDMMSGYGASERDAFALGAFEAIRAKAGAQAGQTELMGLWRQKGLQEKLKAVFGDERSYREFASRMAAEGRMKSLETVGRGSQTAARQYAIGDLDTSAVGAAGDVAGSVASGSPTGMLRSMSNFWNTVKTPEPVRDAIGQTLLSRDPQNLLQLQQAMRQVQAARQRQAVGLGLGLGSQTGNVLGLIN
jgi:hypothetical protein